MTLEAWHEETNGSSQQQHQQQLRHKSPSSHEELVDRQIIRRLLRKHGREGLLNLIEEEETGASLVHNDRESIYSGISSIKSEDAQSVFDVSSTHSSGMSMRSFSNNSSIAPSTISIGSTRSAITSNVSALSAKLLGRNKPSGNQSAESRERKQSVATQSSNASTPVAVSKQKSAFMCGFCKEEDIQKTCTRKNDLKRHMEDFHNMNAQWFCRHRGCHMVFDWQTAYKTHLKQAHGGSRMSLDEAKVSLCPQTVFACGFENCLQVYEASTDADADGAFKEYVSHVVKHFDEGVNSGEWTYSARIRNLMRQSGVLRAWTTSPWPEVERNKLKWDPQTSGILRKRLETRHIGDVQVLIQYAIALGSDPSSVPKYREDFITPVKDQCCLPVRGHKSRAHPMHAGAPQEADPYQFHISRNSNPGLAAYIASQRRVYAPRPPPRAGRSARPPRHSIPTTMPPSTTIASHYGFTHTASPPPSIFDQQHQQHQHQFAMMTQGANGGIIAEDLRNLRSMASGSPERDIDMTDAQMLDPYMTSQFSASYGPHDISSTASVDGTCIPASSSMDQLSFGAYDSTHVSY